MLLGRKSFLMSSMFQRVVVGDEWPSRGPEGQREPFTVRTVRLGYKAGGALWLLTLHIEI